MREPLHFNPNVTPTLIKIAEQARRSIKASHWNAKALGNLTDTALTNLVKPYRYGRTASDAFCAAIEDAPLSFRVQEVLNDRSPGSVLHGVRKWLNIDASNERPFKVLVFNASEMPDASSRDVATEIRNWHHLVSNATSVVGQAWVELGGPDDAPTIFLQKETAIRLVRAAEKSDFASENWAAAIARHEFDHTQIIFDPGTRGLIGRNFTERHAYLAEVDGTKAIVNAYDFLFSSIRNVTGFDMDRALKRVTNQNQIPVFYEVLARQIGPLTTLSLALADAYDLDSDLISTVTRTAEIEHAALRFAPAFQIESLH